MTRAPQGAGVDLPAAAAIAVIGGTGHQGFGLALRWAAAGMRVVIGSRSPDRAREAAARARAAADGVVDGMGNVEAAGEAAVIVVTVPAGAHVDTVTAIAGAAAGKVVIDTTVPLGSPPSTVMAIPEGSAAERAQRILGASTPVVAAFHTVPATLLADLSRPVDCDVLLCGDNLPAKARVVALAEAFGARAIDAGALHQAHTLERLTALLVSVGRRARRYELGIRITGL